MSDGAKKEMEMALDLGLKEGRSADQLSRDIRKLLNEPEKLFRRIRNKETGQFYLSKNAKEYNPGRGMYRSSYKNAMRIARTEINMAYRMSDMHRWSSLEFVVGYEVHRSNHVFHCPMCEQLKGKYPKEFVFTGWHPQCRCFVTSILADRDEFLEYQKKILNGEDAILKSKNEVKDMPEGFKQWMSDNSENIAKSKNKPYFVRDNFSEEQIQNGDWTFRRNEADNVDNAGNETQTEENDIAIKGSGGKPQRQKKEKTPDEKEHIKQRWDIRNERLRIANTPTKLTRALASLKNSGIDYKEVSYHDKDLTTDEIIDRLSGADLTDGSCSSLAFAYAGNKGGLDVLDYRGGDSREYFSGTLEINRIVQQAGGTVLRNKRDLDSFAEVKSLMEVGKEYYFSCAEHATIIRKTDKGIYEFLEMQEKFNFLNGFKELTREKLIGRFGASKKAHRNEHSSALLDIELLYKDSGFREMLGYINTEVTEQRKGKGGGIK